ncbi:MAG: gliding motility-associated C-terminal domain-containing protein [Flavobacteriales bacterium]|nr:gliding motility-associated C-terminal domain-containing protein [Flavobacteriales bacterium]
MKISFVLALICLLPKLMFSQAPGCPNVNAGADTVVDCNSVSCVQLTANYLDVGLTTSYTVSSTPYAPPYPFTGGTQLFIGIDDIWSSVISLPFNFCFFGNTYNQIVIGTNGVISFDLSNAGGFCVFGFSNNIPNPSIPYPNSINGAYHDIDPSVGGDINYAVLGSYPCRTFVVNYNNVPHYSCNSITTTQQIVLYETTNVIEVYINDKPTCNGWNSGNAVIGIQNIAGTIGYTPPGRNTGSWTTSNEAWRFTPSGPSISTINWFESGVSSPISTFDTVTVCPINTTNYIAEVTYIRCDQTIVIETDTVEVDISCCPPQVIDVVTTPSCGAGNDGSIQLSLAAANILNISWTGPNGFTSNTVNISNLISGNYVADITYSNNCPPFTDTIALIDPLVMSANYTFNNISCFGDNDGNIDLTVIGGTLPYTFLWSGPNSFSASSEDINLLYEGIYSVLVSDFNGCSYFYNIPIQEPDKITLSASITDLSCVSVNDGVIDVMVSGGTPSFNYSWSNGASTSLLNNLSVGEYILTLTDNKNCLQTDTFEIKAATFLTSASVFDIKCNGDSDAFIDIEIIGGNYPYTYNWNNGTSTQDIINVGAGVYQVSVTDVTNCTIDTTIIISQPTPLNAIATTTNVSCYGGNNGSSTLQITGGIPPYISDWNGLDTLNFFAGTHPFQITDSNGCVFNASVNISQPDSLSISFNTSNVQCVGDANGAIDISVLSGSGTPNYTFSWTGPNSFISNSEDISNINAGLYTINIADANNCVFEYHLVVEQPTPLSQILDIKTPNFNGYSIACNSDYSAWISVDVFGGYIPYTYQWSNGSNSDSIFGLNAGNYALTITDALGCTFDTSVTLLEPPSTISASINATTDYNGYTVRCFDSNDGAIQVVGAGGVPSYSFLWNNGSTSDSITNLDASYYEVEVTDSNGCIWVGGITLNKPSALEITLSSITDTCERAVGFAGTNVIGGVTPYTYLWSNGQSSIIANNLLEGVYYITSTDANLCEISDSVEVDNIKSPIADFNTMPKHRRYYEQLDKPFIFIDISNTYWQNIINWNWDFDYNGISPTYNGFDSIVKHFYNETGTYRIFLSIETEYHCIDTISKTILIDDFALFIPDAFTPGIDELNNEFKPYGYGIKEYKMMIFSRWGELLFTSKNLDVGWNGIKEGKEKISPLGVYAYYIEIENIFGEIFKYEGTLNLIR